MNHDTNDYTVTVTLSFDLEVGLPTKPFSAGHDVYRAEQAARDIVNGVFEDSFCRAQDLLIHSTIARKS